MIFENTSGQIKLIEGNALIISSNLSGPAEGFATGSFTMKVNGRPDIRETIDTCGLIMSAFAASFVSAGDGGTNVYSMAMTITGTGVVGRYEYSINGGSRVPKFSNPFNFVSAPGSYSFTIWPLCDNGIDGTPKTQTLILS
jgi:hypothetical protein